ncbi:MAG: glycoside hydrolase family 16 protein [Terricaulis sp.]
MKKRLLALAAFCLATPAFADPGAPAINEPGGLPSGYALVWADEFQNDGLPDASRWTYDTDRNRDGWYNNELQYYSPARRENARAENGVLIIEARREDMSRARDWGRQHFTSSRMVTRGLARWTYGFFEIRAKLPCGYGAWPAIWMLPAGADTSWPGGGEIDIMEHVGQEPGVVHGTVHTGAHNHANNTHLSATTTIPDTCDAFHNYQLTWTPDRIVIGVDDRNYYQYSRDAAGGHASWPFDSPQFLLLNVAVGGWGGDDAARLAETEFPQRMEVDYVRVYQAPP